MNLYDVFHAAAQRWPDNCAFLGPEIAMSYAVADKAILRVSSQLSRAGVTPGTCVGLHCPSGIDYVIATYAVWRCGACVMPIPVELTSPEKQQILHTVRVDFVISQPKKSAFLGPFQINRAAGVLPRVDVLRVRPLRDHPANFSTINAAFVRFTSGTTGAAKGIVLSHDAIYDRIQAANEVLRIGADDRIVWLLSMAYHFAVTIVAYLSLGAGLILPSNHFAKAILEAAQRHGGTLIYGSPAHFRWLATAPEAAPLSTLRLAISTTAAVDRSTAEHFRSRFELPLTQALGIIEVGLPFINVRFAHDRPDAVGELLPAYELQLRDIGLGRCVGEILLRGPGFLDAYYEPWRTRSEIMRDGWFHTGDVASMDEDGCVVLRGRRKDVISVLGMKFFPQEVEAVLATHPAVAGACVYGRPDPHMGEAPDARIVLRGGCVAPPVSDLIAHCERQIALFKVPRQFEFVESLPRTASGKVIHRLEH